MNANQHQTREEPEIDEIARGGDGFAGEDPLEIVDERV
jgi:hypothetical protein